MEKDHYFGFIVLLVIAAIVLLGGQKSAVNMQSTAVSQPKTMDQQLSDAQNQADSIQKQIQAEQYAKTHSLYAGLISIQYVNRGNTSDYEYIVLHMNDSATTTAQITGWQLKSLSSQQSVTIPDGTELFFSGQVNGTEPIVMTPGDTVYLMTGVSPVGYNFRLNKCSGYLSQYQTFIPYISTNCPTPQNESLAFIPNITGNRACQDYVKSLSSCRTPTNPIPVTWSYECNNFITTKLTYSSCVDRHKNDNDFYLKEWRVYLGYSQTIWQSDREDIVLYDNNGKIVSELTY